MLLPAIGAGAVALIAERRQELVKLTALLNSVLTGGMSLWVLFAFDKGNADFQLVSKHSWISPWGISWHLGVDGITPVPYTRLTLPPDCPLYLQLNSPYVHAWIPRLRLRRSSKHERVGTTHS